MACHDSHKLDDTCPVCARLPAPCYKVQRWWKNSAAQADSHYLITPLPTICLYGVTDKWLPVAMPTYTEGRALIQRLRLVHGDLPSRRFADKRIAVRDFFITASGTGRPPVNVS